MKSYTYDDIVSGMRTEGWDDKPIDIIKMPNGSLTTIDNTRVLAARNAGINVRANIKKL